MKFIFDTSAIAPNYIQEETSEDVRKLIKRCFINSVEIKCSELAFYELGNVLVKVGVENGAEVMKQFREIFFDPVHSSKKLERMSFQISEELKLTYYDSVHVAITKDSRASLVTNDKRILSKYDNACTPTMALKNLEIEELRKKTS